MNYTRVKRRVERLARDLMAEFGFGDIPFEWDRAVNRIGAAHWRWRRGKRVNAKMTLSGYLLSLYEDEEEALKEFEDVIRHEIAHMLVPEADHDWRWRAMCRKTGADPSRTHTLPKYVRDKITEDKYKYILRCTHCGKVVARWMRQTKGYKHPEIYKSGCCSATVKRATR